MALKKENVVIILDGSQLSSNVAQAARAMANFGFSRLRLVNPLNLPSAERMARGGAEVVRSAEIFTELGPAIADLTWVAGTTGKDGLGSEELVRPELAVAELASLSPQGSVGIVFGCEHHGLTNAQLRRMDRLVHIPTQPDCASINLAQSVAIMSWELEKAFVGPALPLNLGVPAQRKRQALYDRVDHIFRLAGVEPQGRRHVLWDGVRQFFNRQPLPDKDLSVLLRAMNMLERVLSGKTGKD